MLRLEVGKARQPRTGKDLEQYSMWLQTLLKDERFVELLNDTADAIIRAWDRAVTPITREAEWNKLQGLKELLRQMTVNEDHGILHARGVEGALPGRTSLTP